MFIEGNDLPAAWQGAENAKERFVIAETGFGTGLNFLATWQLFEETAEPGQKLNFISFEKFPLSKEQIQEALESWDFGARLEVFLDHYPIHIPGFHRLVLNDRVALTLIFDDVNDAMRRVEAEVDAWFLDGFRPASNPEMWTDVVFQEMARLSRPGTSFATFTAAGFVKRGLQEVGFDVRKVPGFGSKREMLVGRKV